MAATALTDTLAQLRDIHSPPPPGWWPPALGWWLVCTAVIALLAIVFALYYRRRQRLAPYRQALRDLHAISQQNDQGARHDIARLLRRIVILRDPSAAALPLELALPRCAASVDLASVAAIGVALAGRFAPTASQGDQPPIGLTATSCESSADTSRDASEQIAALRRAAASWLTALARS